MGEAMSLMRRFVQWYTYRKEVDVNIGPGYLLRWFVIPRNRFFNIYLHCFLRSDEDFALHDHPWYNISIVLLERYFEHTPRGKFLRKPGSIVFRKGTSRHRIELPIINGGMSYCWSLFITGPRYREWGFWLEGKNFVSWRDHVAIDAYLRKEDKS